MRTTEELRLGTRLRLRHGFSLAELMVVAGIIAILVALLLPPLQAARYQAMRLQCATRLQQHGVALTGVRNELGYYPLADDGTNRVRFTWVDVLIQRRYLGDFRSGYCPNDLLPDPLNRARGQATGALYPGRITTPGVDYSYGIGVPLSSGGWNWVAGHGRPDDTAQRRFEGHEKNVARRVLAADANWSYIYNLSGEGYTSGAWNDPSWYDNLVAWRHPDFVANLLMQDGHVELLRYRADLDEPINTMRAFLWYPGEPVHAGPDSRHGDNFYPDTPPPRYNSRPPGDVFPKELIPEHYTLRQAWTLITHK